MSCYLLILSAFPVYAGGKWESVGIQEKGNFLSAPIIKFTCVNHHPLKESRARGSTEAHTFGCFLVEDWPVACSPHSPSVEALSFQNMV